MKMKKIIEIIGWILSYLHIIAVIPFGTCTQGDDDPWRGSLFFALIALFGFLLIILGSIKSNKKSFMGLPHFFSLILILFNTPSYWIRVTFQGRHICAGFNDEYLNSFDPELWHRFWAPIITIEGLIFVFLGYIFFRNCFRD
jgi:hypothetical protein